MVMQKGDQGRGPMWDALTDLNKAVTTSTINEIVKEDLEPEAHNTLWKASSPFELTAMKLMPVVNATQIKHEFDKVISYGDDRGDGFFGEEMLPLETEPDFTRHETFIRLMGEMSQTFILAAMEETIRVNGQVGAASIARSLLMLNLLKKKNRAIYMSDTRTIRSGTASPRFQGLLQQIEEGTDGTNGSSPYGSHVVDMEGASLTIENLREKCAKIITLFGYANCLITDPFVRADLEAGLDPATRLNLPIGASAFMMGQNVGGIQTQGGQMFFHTDNGLTPLHNGGRYRGTMMRGAPTNPPAVSGAVGAPGGGRTSKWNAGDSGNFAWVVTEWKNGRESLGRRWPAGSAFQAVAAGQEVTLTITPTDPTSDSFKIYRLSEGEADTDAWFCFEVSNSGGGAAVPAYDGNHYRPNTSYAFGLSLSSDAQKFLHSPVTDGTRSRYADAAAMSEQFLRQPDNEQNACSVVQFGPAMGVMELAPVQATKARPLLFSACAVQVRNPLKCFVIRNIGTISGA
jgi:hypothetical protein